MIVEKIKFTSIIIYFVIYLVIQIGILYLYRYFNAKYLKDETNKDNELLSIATSVLFKWWAFIYAILLIMQFYIRR